MASEREKKFLAVPSLKGDWWDYVQTYAARQLPRSPDKPYLILLQIREDTRLMILALAKRAMARKGVQEVIPVEKVIGNVIGDMLDLQMAKIKEQIEGYPLPVPRVAGANQKITSKIPLSNYPPALDALLSKAYGEFMRLEGVEVGQVAALRALSFVIDCKKLAEAPAGWRGTKGKRAAADKVPFPEVAKWFYNPAAAHGTESATAWAYGVHVSMPEQWAKHLERLDRPTRIAPPDERTCVDIQSTSTDATTQHLLDWTIYRFCVLGEQSPLLPVSLRDDVLVGVPLPSEVSALLDTASAAAYAEGVPVGVRFASLVALTAHLVEGELLREAEHPASATGAVSAK